MLYCVEHKNEFYKSAQNFIELTFKELLSLGFNENDLQHPDHICFRVATLNEYETYKIKLLDWGALITETPVNGRLIATYRLKTPIQFKNYCLSIIELPSPKLGSPYQTGFEHIEFVIKKTFQTFKANYSSLSFEQTNDKTLNSELCFKISIGQVKFHYIPLERVIEIEEKSISDIVFDLDGTLIDSKDKILQINQEVFSKMLNRVVSVQECQTNFATTFSELFSNFGIHETEKQKEGIDLWSHFSEKIRFELFDGVKSMIEKLKSHGTILHIWTSRDESSSFKILHECGIENYFSSISCANSNNSKPNINNFKILDSHNKKQFLMIGDSTTDMKAAHNINSVAGAVLWDPSVQLDDLIMTGAELFFKHPSDVVKWILSE